MKKLFLLSIILISLLFLNCSGEKKGNKIVGKWKTIDNRNNSEIVMDITDSTILTEFWFDEGIKKIQYRYTVEEEQDSSMIIRTQNIFNQVTFDTIYFNSGIIRFCTQDGSEFSLSKQIK